MSQATSLDRRDDCGQCISDRESNVIAVHVHPEPNRARSEFTISAEDRAKHPAEYLLDISSWQGRQFYGARIVNLRGALNAANLAKFEAMSYADKCRIIGKLVEKGSMI